MQRLGQVPDKRLLQKVEQHISRKGLGSQTKISVQVRNGDVTLSGTLQYETERRPALHAARSVEGVRRIVDQLQVKAAPKKWQQANPGPSSPVNGPGGMRRRDGMADTFTRR